MDEPKTPTRVTKIVDGFIDTPLPNTPRPQASSTVERRTFGSRHFHGDYDDGYKYNAFSGKDDKSVRTNDSSLGILDNLSSFSMGDNTASREKQTLNFANIADERERARKLLQRCSDINFPNLLQTPGMDTNKENNANSPNLSGDRTPSTLVDSAQSFNISPSMTKEQSTLRTPGRKVSNISVNFEPNEITARSSAMSKSMERSRTQSPAPCSGGISFSSENAGLMEEFDSGDFRSGSQMASQFIADELSFQQNGSYALPVATSTEKEHLDLSCFSGIMGEMDLSLESCAGRKVSVGEFFKRKCENLGDLDETSNTCDRPNFGVHVRSPQRIGKNIPLIDITTMTEDSSNSNEPDDKLLASFIDNTREHTLMSLSTIAQTLQNIDNGTPRRLVDQLLMVKKQKKKCPQTKMENLTSATYSLPASSRCSLPINSINSSKKFEDETGLLGLTSKLSLGSKSVSDTSMLKYQNTSRDSRTSAELMDMTNSQEESGLAEILEDRKKSREMPNITNYLSRNNVTQSVEQSSENAANLEPKHRESKAGVKIRRETESPRKLIQSHIKKEEISAQRSALEASVSTNSPTPQSSLGDYVRISKNTQELHNCVVGIQREVDVELENKSHKWVICAFSLNQIQGDRDNIELEVTPKVMLLPDASKTVKVGVKVLKPGKPTIVALHVEISELPSRVTCRLQHVMCFVPEEANVSVSTQSGEDKLDFGNTLDRISKTLPITVTNGNGVDVPVHISIVNNEHRKFAIEFPVDRPNDQIRGDDDFLRLLLKPSETVRTNIRFNPPPDTGNREREVETAPAKILVSINDEEKRDGGSLIKELQLIGNRGPVKSSVFPAEKPNDYSRCDTPQQLLGMMSSPTSPHSSASNRSGISGRNSPHSCASGGTVAGSVISIRATHAALAWNSVKVGKNDTKDFTIRNTSNNKIKLEATIVDSDKSFKFLRERQQVASHIILGLQRMESRTLSVVFGPNNPGAAAGRIVFKHYEPKSESQDSRPSKVIFLYGYGGVGKVEITEAFKDTGGQLWLSLGSLNSGGTLDAKIKLQNTGDLCSYAKVKLTPKAVYPAMVSSWHVDPTELLLGPKEIRWVTLEFRPRKEDLALLKRANVSHVGTLTITHGDEPTRLRIRRLYKKLSQTGQMSGKETEAFRNVVYPICKVFPGETPIHNLKTIRDSVENLGDLCRGVRQHEVMLTMEINAEESLSILHDNADESQMFYSLCSDDSNVFPATEESFMPSETLMECTTKERIFEDDFAVDPTIVTLSPPAVNEATVMIMSSSNVAEPFETVLSHAEYLSVVPAEGMIPTRRGFPLRIRCKKRLDRNLEAALQVYTANSRRDIQIKVLL